MLRRLFRRADRLAVRRHAGPIHKRVQVAFRDADPASDFVERQSPFLNLCADSVRRKAENFGNFPYREMLLNLYCIVIPSYAGSRAIQLRASTPLDSSKANLPSATSSNGGSRSAVKGGVWCCCYLLELHFSGNPACPPAFLQKKKMPRLRRYTAVSHGQPRIILDYPKATIFPDSNIDWSIAVNSSAPCRTRSNARPR